MVQYQPHELDGVFGALADPLRREMLAELKLGERTATQLHQNTTVSLVAVLKHLEVLESAGLIRTEKRGRSRCCQFRPDRLAVAETWLAEMRTIWSRALRQLDDHLNEENL